MPRSGNPNGGRGREVVRASSRHLGHGMAMAASVALFGWMGSEIGARVGSRAVLTLLGIFVGAAAGFYSIYVQLVIRPRKETDSERSED